MDSAIPTPAKAMMSGPCFVLCANHSTKNALFCNIVRKGGLRVLSLTQLDVYIDTRLHEATLAVLDEAYCSLRLGNVLREEPLRTESQFGPGLLPMKFLACVMQVNAS